MCLGRCFAVSYEVRDRCFIRQVVCGCRDKCLRDSGVELPVVWYSKVVRQAFELLGMCLEDAV